MAKGEMVCVCVDKDVCVSPAGAGGSAAAACGPAGAGELPWWRAAATSQHRAAESAELWGETGGPHGGAACWGPVQSRGSREPAHRALQVRRGRGNDVHYLSGHLMFSMFYHVGLLVGHRVIPAFPPQSVRTVRQYEGIPVDSGKVLQHLNVTMKYRNNQLQENYIHFISKEDPFQKNALFLEYVYITYMTWRCPFLIRCASDEKQSSCGGNTWGESGCIKLSHSLFFLTTVDC